MIHAPATALSPVARLRKAAAEALRPPPNVTVSQWAADYRWMVTSNCKEPGQWKRDRAPYLNEPMDRLSISDPCTTVVLMMAAQLGKTEVLLNWLGYIIDVRPGPTMCVQPTGDDCRELTQERLDPLIEHCAPLRGKVAEITEREGVNTTMRKQFAGGTIYFRGANSPSKLASKPVRYLLMDEADRYPPSVGDEGDPIDLAVERLSTFGRQKKILISSTPTTEDGSRISRAFLGSDQHRYWVPCPHCGIMQMLEWKRMHWPDGAPDAAALRCANPACTTLIEDHHKLAMLPAGRWMPWIEQAGERAEALAAANAALGRNAEEPDFETVGHEEWRRRARRTGGRAAGYHLNALYCPHGLGDTFADLAAKWLAAQNDPERLRVFVNTKLAEVWRGMRGEEVAPHAMARLCESYPRAVPDPVCWLTCGCDVQDDRVEMLVAGWGVGCEPWHIEHFVLHGDPNGPELWSDVDQVLLARYDGLPIAAACIDIGGHHGETVKAFCRPRWGRRVWAVKGSSVAGDPVWPLWARRAKRAHDNFRVFVVGVHAAKESLFLRMEKGTEDRFRFHFPLRDGDEALPPEYFEQLCSERRLKRMKGGREISWFEKSRARNEVLDCWVYAYCAARALESMGWKFARQQSGWGAEPRGGARENWMDRFKP